MPPPETRYTLGRSAQALRFLCGVALIAAIAGCGAPPTQTDPTERETYTRPSIALATVQEARELMSAAQGRTLVINFWATWCPPCVKEMPELADFYRAYGDKVEFLSFSVDLPDTLDSHVKPFIYSYEIPFPVHLVHAQDDTEWADLELDWNGGLPATFVFGPDGSVARSWVEAVTLDKLADALSELGVVEAAQ